MKIFAAVLALIFVNAEAHAQYINWLGASSITGDSDVFTTGTYVDGFQAATGGFNGKPTTTQTVNGVDFHVNNSYTFTDGTFSLSGPSGVGDGTDGGYPSVGTAAYQAVLSNCAYSGSAVTVTMSGLTAGKTYEIQVWNSTPYDDTILTGSTPTDTQYLDIGQFALGTFVAGATNSFSFDNGPSRSNVGVIDAIEIREVPEPSTYGAMALGVLALAGVMRMRKLAA